jgi:D-alanyl-D-alanine carboxypeptidase
VNRSILCLFLLACSGVTAPLVAQDEERAVLAVVHQLFDGMRARDTARMRALLHPQARMASPGTRNGVFAVTVESPDGWLAQIGRSTGAVLDERITAAEVKVDGALASVWAAYSFYIGDRFSHCGVDAFHLVRMPEGWRIIDLADTRRREGCAPPGDSLAVRLQGALDSLRALAGFPGATLGVALPDGRVLELATGLADTARRTRLSPTDLMLAGSTGKTFFAALALQLVSEGRLRLDAPISEWLGKESWFARLPNAKTITVRQLMSHTSGLVRYEFKDAFTRDLSAAPERSWRPEELVAYILDSPAPFLPGTGWEYSDTNYIVLAMILERVTGTPAYAEISRRFLVPLRLSRVVPSTSRTLPGLAQGYAGLPNPFGGSDAMISGERLAINPQFEWAGGGYATSAPDLARWARALYGGTAVDSSVMREALTGVPARLGPNTRYGLGVIIWPGEHGGSVGHSGFFPGYRTEMRYFPEGGFAVALQVNTSNPKGLGRSPGAMLTAMASIVRQGLSPR